MSREDRSLVEELFTDGFAQVLVCTGTCQSASPCGRRERNPDLQSGQGTICFRRMRSKRLDLQDLSKLNQNQSIESQFVSRKLVGNLNAEIVLGTIRNCNTWLRIHLSFRANTSLGGFIRTLPLDSKIPQNRSHNERVSIRWPTDWFYSSRFSSLLALVLPLSYPPGHLLPIFELIFNELFWLLYASTMLARSMVVDLLIAFTCLFRLGFLTSTTITASSSLSSTRCFFGPKLSESFDIELAQFQNGSINEEL
ncbi:uncharacterized protein EV420DRAFT_1652757 [Desarmillaria tabescens]|uniref:Uncharacterized protein n=1 Tax=Armillaria tabescens TaxID=1929756 RepID=A0AA39MIX2_ARMTA|nr:uncharacterized protein EV420DRAFT_1652757 [Desarmillaria tabescens]KAK0436037.1 hypothetical protein EV420DRAFT_1652757 [Desarmillaria tabescens]